MHHCEDKHLPYIFLFHALNIINEIKAVFFLIHWNINLKHVVHLQSKLQYCPANCAIDKS